MSRSRRHFSDEVKANVERRHISDKVPVSDLDDEFDVQPSLIHTWVKQVKDHAEKAFRRPKKSGRPQSDSKDSKIASLEAKLAAKNEFISELMEENVKAKKANGEL